MAGFEVVVRPVVFPNIRPAPPRSLPPADDPEKGFAVIRGNGAKEFNLSYSFSASSTLGKSKETRRRVDEARVYQKEDNGTVNRDNFIDIEVANKIWTKGGPKPTSNFKGFTGDDVVPTIEGRGYTGDDIKVTHYKRIKAADNIEIKKRDVIKENDTSGQ